MPSNVSASADPFDDILNLEDEYHTEGYELGVADGSRTGRIEGRAFGLEKGFEKFLELGRLGGRAAIWNAGPRIGDDVNRGVEPASRTIAGRKSERLGKHVSRLRDLTDPETLSMENDEDAVSEFDDRLKDAKAKAALVSKIIGEGDITSFTEDGQSTKSPKQGLRLRKYDVGKQTNEMEDFVGLPRGTKVTKSS